MAHLAGTISTRRGLRAAPTAVDNRAMLATFVAGAAFVMAIPQAEPAQPAPAPGGVAGLAQGPFPGHCDEDGIHLWARAATAGRYTLRLWRPGEDDLPAATAEADAAHDLTLHWHLTGLRGKGPAPFGFRLLRDGELVASVGFGYLRAACTDAAPSATVAFGSCADERKFPAQPIWGQILAAQPDALVLLGDTPYIDSTRLAVQRRRYAEFHDHADVAGCLRCLSTYATWDDHDYTTNDRFGDVDDREHSRQAFVENHALAAYGDGTHGIYTSFRRGPLEVFVLDTRWFADTEPSPFGDGGQRTLLGKRQCEWLQRGLLASTAPYKVLASGMVWNGAVRPAKQDTWANWPHERDGLWRWLGEHRITGVVLVGGDLHVQRVLRHATKAWCGYDLLEFVTSPLAAEPIPANAGKCDGVVFDAAVASAFLLLEVRPGDGEGPRLLGRFRDAAGKEMYTAVVALSELAPRAK